MEAADPRVPLRQHGQGGCLDAPHIQRAVVEDGEKTGGVDPHQPVRFLAAECRLIQGFILRTRPEVGKALPDRRILH